MIKVLLATNDSILERMLQVTLTINGLSVTSVADLTGISTHLHREEFNILLLDRNFADAGLLVRRDGFKLPILALTKAPKASSTKDVEFLADPFDFPSLKIKMNSMLKRRYSLKEKIIEAGQMKIDVLNQLVTVKNEVMSLGKVEFAILVSLTRKAGNIVSKEKLRSDLEAQGQFFNTAIYHHIKELKRKLKVNTNERFNIKFVTGEGYQLMTEG